MAKPILCIDFDGVIHDYKNGWQDGRIYGDVTPGFFRWAEEAAEHFSLVVYSSRSKTQEGIDAMRHWLTDQFVSFGLDHSDEVRTVFIDCEGDRDVKFKIASRPVFRFEFAHEKPPAFLTIDDRAIAFEGDWGSPWLNPAALRVFKPWNLR